MMFTTTWLSKRARLKTALSAVALCTLTSTAMAAAIDKSAIQFIGPLSDDMQLKPYQTEHRDAIIDNLLPHLPKNNPRVCVFRDEQDWQAFVKVSALTLGGRQALKSTASDDRFRQGKL